MSDTTALDFEWQSDAASLKEAMALAGQHLFGSQRWLWSLLSVVLGILTAMGGAGVVFFLSLLVWDSTDPGIALLLVGTAAGAGLLICYQSWPLAAYARNAATSAYGRGLQTAHATPQGITFSNAHTDWRSDWAGVNTVVLGKTGITVGVSGIAFVIPLSAFVSPGDMGSTADHLKSWHEAAA